MSENTNSATVAIIGAGPAGLFAARELASQGVTVVLFNRDIKPGGLAEYGIYPEKLRMKEGLRTQFREIINLPNVHYYGNVMIGEKYALSLQDLREMGFAAILVTCGAQGTKWLGLAGEDCVGAYHAKHLVYHYNHLPPYGTQEIKIGKRVVVIGVGNVMVDVVRYLTTRPQVEEITTIARRGPAEVKFEKKELEAIISHLDWQDFRDELERVTPTMRALVQDPGQISAIFHSVAEKVEQEKRSPVWRLHFLYSPAKIFCDGAGEVSGIQLEENTLELRNGAVKARGLGIYKDISADTVIFAIGDRVNDDLGLPLQGNEFAKHPSPRYPIDGNSYEFYNLESPASLGGVFVGGWSRNASSGLVGITRKDGVNAARAVLAYLEDNPPKTSVEISQVERELTKQGYRVVTPAALTLLETAEKKQAEEYGLPEYKFDSNEEMLYVMGLDS